MLPKGISYGNEVRITLKDRTVKGYIIPRSQLLDPDIYNIKLSNGYNIGIARDHVVSMEKIGEGISLKRPSLQLKKQDKSLPSIGIVTCGGTICCALDYVTGGVSYSLDVAELFAMCPSAQNLVHIDGITKSVIKDSSEMGPEDWQHIAEDVYNFAKQDHIVGVLLLSGTDSLHYLANSLSFMLRNLDKPIVLTYSQRSTDRASTDAVLNLDAAVRMTLSKIPSVMLVGHAHSEDTFCQALRGTTVRKMHSSRRDAFRPINDSPLALIREGVVEMQQFVRPPKGQLMLNNNFEKKIAFIQFVPGMDPDILDYYQKKGYSGVVISMLGLGQIAADDAMLNWIPTIERVTKEGMIICATPQTIYGSLQPNVYATGRRLQKSGVIYLENMLSETAYVKLGCALGRWNNKRQVQQYMLSNVAGELNKTIGYHEFMN